jgi:LacI family transcriptional regulator
MQNPTSRVTINDVARLAGVSTKTISRVLNQSPLVGEETRARVEAAIAETGFVPSAQARALALRRNFLVGLVHDGSDRGIVEAVERGMLSGMEGSELSLVLRPVEGDPSARLRAFLDQHQPLGVVLLPPLSERDELARICDEAGARCVRLGKVREGRGLACDDRSAMTTLVAWLIRLGHRRIGLVGGPEASLTARQRELGYLDAMADHDLDRGPSLIVPGDNSFDSGIQAGRLLLEVSPRPTAIVACNDEMAAGVMQAAGLAGLAVPEGLSIVGFDDTPLAERIWPPLTSMRVPWEEMAREAVSILRSSAEWPDAQRAFTAELVVRNSVLPFAGQAEAATPLPAERSGVSPRVSAP